MKLTYLLTLVFAFSCNFSNNTKEISRPRPCPTEYDRDLAKYSESFEASTIDLAKSISPSLDSFLIDVDTNCLRKEKRYKVFITTILAKLYYYHLKCCNQGYDLQSMAHGGAGVLINEFKRIAGYNELRLEMLNSSTVVDYVDHHQELKDNIKLNIILKKIYQETARIEKGNL